MWNIFTLRGGMTGAWAVGLLFSLMLNSCTGGQNALPSGAGSIRITPGDDLVIDLTDVILLGASGINVSLKSISNDYQTFSEFHDVTPLAREALAQSKSSFSFVVPKNVAPPKPFVVVVDIPDLQDYLIDAIFEGQSQVRPGLASRLTFDLLDSYYTEFTPKSLNQYSAANFTTIREHIQARIDSLHSQSEHLGYSTLPLAKLMRFYKNALAFSPAHLDLFNSQGVRFAYDRATISGVNISKIPSDQTLSSCYKGFCYEFAKNFRVVLPNNTEKPATKPPFKHDSNAPAQMMAGVARPAPGLDLTVNEKVVTSYGESPAISVSAQGFDLDEDYMEKSMRVIYTPRKLPDYWKNTANRPLYSQAIEDAWNARHPPTDQTLLGLSNYDLPDTYTLQSIDYDEALNPNDYFDPSGNNVCNGCTTAVRDVFFFVTDGMAWLPYRWKFSYIDQNRQPQFMLNEQGGINSTHFDEFLRVINGNEAEVPNVPGWRLHASHCENDPNATPTPVPQAGPGGTVQVLNYYTRIKQKSDGPWSCAFKVFDPDIRDDPNGAPDDFYFSALRENDPFTVINLGARLNSNDSTQLDPLGLPVLAWPPLSPYTMDEPLKLKAMTESSDPDVCGSNRRCATGMSQVIIDNAVKNAAESQANQTIDITLRVYDRKSGGQSNQKTITRGVQFQPNPPMLVNFSTPALPGGTSSLVDIIKDENLNDIHARTDTFAAEIRSFARVHSSVTGYEPVGLHPDLLNSSIRNQVFQVQDLEGTLYSMSPYITQPHTQCDSATNFGITVGPDLSSGVSDPTNGADCRNTFNLSFSGLNVTNFRPHQPVLLGSTLRKVARSGGGGAFDLFRAPREQDLTCNANTDPTGTFDQRAPSSSYLGTYDGVNSFYSHPAPLFGPTPSPTPHARTPLAVGGFTFEINAVDYDNLDLRSGEPADPVFLTLETDQAAAGQFRFCVPPTPNLDSRLGETYLPTNPAQTNGIDPDSCQTWSDNPPTRLQPVPLFYTGTDSTGSAVPRKMVYHRLRVLWTPRDQGREKKLDTLDPKGLIRNFISSIRLNGNVYAQKFDTRDKTEPFVIDSGKIKKIQLPVLAIKRELPTCNSGSLVGQDTLIFDSNPDSGPIRFGLKDGNHVNSEFPTHDGAVTGIYEMDLQLLGESNPTAVPPVSPRSMSDPELLKFIPYTVDCTGIERRDLARSGITYRWRAVQGANSYLAQYTEVPPSSAGHSTSWVDISTVNETGASDYSVTVQGLESYRTYYFRHLVNGAPQAPSLTSAIQVNPSPTPGPSPSQSDVRIPALWHSTNSSGTGPKIRFKSTFNQLSPQFCIRHTQTPVKDQNDIPYVGVWRISRRSPNPQPLLNNPIRFRSTWLETCTGRPYIDLDPYMQEVLVAVKNVTHAPTGKKCIPSSTDPDFPRVFQGSSMSSLNANGQEVSPLITVHDANDADSVEIRLVYQIQPELPFFGALTSPTPAPALSPGNFRIDWFPSLYGANVIPTLSRGGWMVQDLNAANALFFGVTRYGTFIFDQNPASTTFGRSRYLGLTKSNNCTNGCFRPHPMAQSRPIPESAISIDFSTGDSTFPATVITPTPAPPLEHHYSVRIIDFDVQPTKINVAEMLNDTSCANAGAGSSCFRMKGDNSLQLFSWAPDPTGTPSSVSYAFRAYDQLTATEDDPYDVLTYQIATPSPNPTANPLSTPSLSGLGGIGGRLDCTTGPTNYPQTATLRMDTLDSFKKCRVNWTQHSSDAGKEFKFDIWAQDNLGANPASTPILMGHGGKHPQNNSNITIPFFWDASRTADIAPLGQIIPVTGSSATVQYTVDPPNNPVFVAGNFTGEWDTYDPNLATCAPTIPPPNRICTRARSWVSIPSSSCTQSSRFCLVTVPAVNLYKKHYFRTTQLSQTNGVGPIYSYTNNGTRESLPYYERQPIPAVGAADAAPITNSPRTRFTLEIYSLERNKAPFFTQSGTSNTPLSASAKYTGASGTNWSTVFPGGVAPSSCTGSDSRFNCQSTRLTINPSDDNYLWEPDGSTGAPSPILLDEIPAGGTKYTFTVFAKDTANLTALKTLQVQPPTQVYIVDRNTGSSYTPPSFSGSRIEFDPGNATPGIANISFKWAPTDEEANALSNPGGFLIPIRVNDSKYDPSRNESGFNTNFVVGAKSATIWIWCKLRVRNNAPTITYFENGVWTPLSGATLQFQTGTNSPIRVRVSDPDVDRIRRGDTGSFFPSNYFGGNPGFTSASGMTSPTPSSTSPASVIQEFNLNANPTNANIGLSPMNLTIQDPGDPSLGLAVDPDSSNPPRAQVSVAPITFFVNVVGKPSFLVPAPPIAGVHTRAHSYALFPMNYPLSLLLTRPYERTDSSTPNFFMGIQVKPAMTVPTGFFSVPLATQVNGSGFFINERYLLRINNASTFNSTADGQNRLISIGAVIDSGGNCFGRRDIIEPSAQFTLARIRESASVSGVFEYCNISSTNATNNLALTALQHTLHSNKPSFPSLAKTQVSRQVISNASDYSVLNQEFRDFQIRCIYCTNPPTGNTGFGLWAGEINSVNPGSSTLTYESASNQKATFTVATGTNLVTKVYEDTTPTLAGRQLRLTTFKGETLNFLVDLSATPTGVGRVYARWYVNGCLKSTQRIDSPSLQFSIPVAMDAGGRNDDCSGQFQRSEPNTDDLGVLRVTLRLTDGSDVVATGTPGVGLDGSPSGYTFVVQVVNQSPMPQLSTGTRSNPRAQPLPALSTSTNEMKFLFPLTGGGRNLFAFTERLSSSTNLRVRELQKNGSLSTSGLNLTVNCINFNSEPNWIGIETGPQDIKFAMVNSSGRATDTLSAAYSTNTSSTYGQASTTCYRSWSPAYVSGTVTNQASPGTADTAARIIAFSRFTSGSRAFAALKDGSGGGHVIDGVNASSDFWSASFPMIGAPPSFNSSIFSSPLAALNGYPGNTIHRNYIDGTRLFQAIGHDPTKDLTQALGHLVISSIAPNGKTIAGSVLQSIAFGSGSCNFTDSDSVNRTNRIVPVDLIYHANSDTLLVLASDNTSNPRGRLIEVSNAVSNPFCRQVTDSLTPPSRVRVEFNTSIQKLAIDGNDVLWGVIAKSKTEPGQVFTYDLISKKTPIRQSLSFPPHSIVYSPGINAFHIPSFIPTLTSPASPPTLYRVW